MDARVLRSAGEREIRCGDQDSRAKAAELLQGTDQRQGALVVHVAGRLVREHQIGPADDRARDCDALPFRQGQRRRALRHWLAYVRLDPVGPWAKHAKEQARKILNTEKLSIVSRRGRTVKAAG